MSFPNMIKRLWENDGSGTKLRGDIMPYGAATPKASGTASAGTADSVSRSDHVHPVQTSVSGNAGSATKLATKRTIDGVNFDGTANISHYGTCSTEAATAAKVVSISNFVLATGSIAFVRFTVTNSAANPTMNINGTGAKAIRYRNAAISAGYLAANRTYCFIYDGASYQLVGDIDTNTTYKAATATAAGLVKASTAAQASTVPLAGSDGKLDASWEKASGVSAGAYGPTANTSPAFGQTFSVPSFTVDARGKITAAASRTITLPKESSGSSGGNAATATKLQTARKITVKHVVSGSGKYGVNPNYTGSGSVSFDGSGDVTISINMGSYLTADSNEWNCSTD